MYKKSLRNPLDNLFDYCWFAHWFDVIFFSGEINDIMLITFRDTALLCSPLLSSPRHQNNKSGKITLLSSDVRSYQPDHQYQVTN